MANVQPNLDKDQNHKLINSRVLHLDIHMYVNQIWTRHLSKTKII